MRKCLLDKSVTDLSKPKYFLEWYFCKFLRNFGQIFIKTVFNNFSQYFIDTGWKTFRLFDRASLRRNVNPRFIAIIS